MSCLSRDFPLPKHNRCEIQTHINFHRRNSALGHHAYTHRRSIAPVAVANSAVAFRHSVSTKLGLLIPSEIDFINSSRRPWFTSKLMRCARNKCDSTPVVMGRTFIHAGMRDCSQHPTTPPFRISDYGSCVGLPMDRIHQRIRLSAPFPVAIATVLFGFACFGRRQQRFLSVKDWYAPRFRVHFT